MTFFLNGLILFTKLIALPQSLCTKMEQTKEKGSPISNSTSLSTLSWISNQKDPVIVDQLLIFGRNFIKMTKRTGTWFVQKHTLTDFILQ
jgi:hypothetical protein